MEDTGAQWVDMVMHRLHQVESKLDEVLHRLHQMDDAMARSPRQVCRAYVVERVRGLPL